MISYLQVDNLSKRFGEQLLFENISFGIGKVNKTMYRHIIVINILDR